MQLLTLISNGAVTGLGPVAGSTQAIAAAAADYTLNLEIINLTATRIRVGIEDSPDGIAWSPIAVWIIPGPIPSYSQALRSYAIAGLKANARVNVYELTGQIAGAHLTASVSY